MISKSQLERIIAKGEHDRRTRFSLESFGKADLFRNRLRLGKEFTDLLAKAGVDIEEANNSLSKYRAEEKRIRESQTAHAGKHFSHTEQSVRQAISDRRKALQQFANIIQPSGTSYFHVETPLEISASPRTILVDSTLAPGNSSATALFGGSNFDGEADDSQSVSFIFDWKNPLAKDARVLVNAYLVVKGTWFFDIPPGYIIGGGFVTMGSDVELSLFQNWNVTPSSPVWQPSQRQFVFGLEHVASDWNSGLFGGSPDIQQADIFSTYWPQYFGFEIPPSETAVFEVSLTFSFQVSPGAASFDLRPRPGHPGFIICPGLELDVTWPVLTT